MTTAPPPMWRDMTDAEIRLLDALQALNLRRWKPAPRWERWTSHFINELWTEAHIKSEFGGKQITDPQADLLRRIARRYKISPETGI